MHAKEPSFLRNRPPGITAHLLLILAIAVLVGSCVQVPPAGPTTLPSPLATPTAAAGSASTPTARSASSTPVPTATATVAATATASPTATTLAPSPTAEPTAAPEAVSGAAAWRHAERLSTSIGSRPVGSAAERAAADYIAEQLAGYGYVVERQRFAFQTFDDRQARLAIEEPTRIALVARPLRFSAGGDVRAAVVDAGLGRAEDFAGKEVAGKIALLRRGEITLAAKADNALAAGAAAVVISNSEPGNFNGTLGEPRGIPTVSISLEEGERVRELLAHGEVIARLVLDPPRGQSTSENVVATREGREPGVVVVGAHYDSVPAGPGANDNASGVGAALEVARVLAETDYPYTVKIIAFGAEEIGLVGSRHYVSGLTPEQRRSIVAMVNLDMVGVGDEMRLAGSAGLVERALALAAEQNVAASRLLDRRADASDHASFREAGVPVLFITWTPDPNYHTEGDVVGHVSPETLAVSGRLALAVLAVKSNE